MSSPGRGPIRASSVGVQPRARESFGRHSRRPGNIGRFHSCTDPLSKTGIQPVIVFEEDDTVVEPGDLGSSGPYAPARPTRSSRRALQRSSRPPSRLPAVLGDPRCGRRDSCRRGGCPWCNGSHHHTTSPPASFSYHRNHTCKTGRRRQTCRPSVNDRTTDHPAGAVYGYLQSASYPAPSSAYTVTSASSGACWVYAKLASTGAVVWTGTLDSGQAQTLDATGSLIVELGHANTLSATLNGVPVEYPAQYQAVFTMNIRSDDRLNDS